MQLRFLALALAACGGSDPAAPPADGPADAPVDVPPDVRTGFCASEDRDDDYVAGMQKTGANGFTVILVESDPVPDPKGNYTFDIRVLDPAQAPADNLTIRVFPAMPDHGHGTSPTPVITNTGGGNYTVTPINLFMTGYWTIRHSLRDSTEAELDGVTYAFCVD